MVILASDFRRAQGEICWIRISYYHECANPNRSDLSDRCDRIKCLPIWGALQLDSDWIRVANNGESISRQGFLVRDVPMIQEAGTTSSGALDSMIFDTWKDPLHYLVGLAKVVIVVLSNRVYPVSVSSNSNTPNISLCAYLKMYAASSETTPDDETLLAKVTWPVDKNA